MDHLQIKILHGKEMVAFLPEIAHLRITVFREYPYLYEGDFDYEANYLKVYTECDESTIILVFYDKKLIGVSTALPLSAETTEVKRPFVQAGMNIDDIFYFGESIVLSEHRGHGIGKLFFQEREKAARANHYKIAAFCAVARLEHHPLRPNEWQPLDSFWQQQGYQKHPELVTQMSWKDIGDADETAKPMIFWLKNL